MVSVVLETIKCVSRYYKNLTFQLKSSSGVRYFIWFQYLVWYANTKSLYHFKLYPIWMLFKTIEKSAAFELLFLKVSKVQLQKLTFLIKVNPTIFMSILWSFKNVFFKKFPVSWAHLSASSGKNWWPESAALTYSNIRYKNCYVCSWE